MILGMSVADFTTVHVLLSLIGLFAGAAIVVAMMGGKPLMLATAVFLCSTALTSATGFLFHSAAIGPAHIVGLVSLAVLILACVALYRYHLHGLWRLVYVATTVMAFYFDAFVALAQAFAKVASLRELAPNGSGPTFLAAQLALLAVFLALGLLAAKRFHPDLAQAA
jgi:hypothetical protein